MELPLPSESHPELTAERLAQVSAWLMEEWYSTEDDLSSPYDDGYTRGCARFGRQKNRIKKEALSGKRDWLGLVNGGNDLVFTIVGIPCRFSNDDAGMPTKGAVVAINRYQVPFLEFVEQDQPGRFCFVIDQGANEAQEPRVEFLGFSPSGELACRWVSADVVRSLSVTSEALAEAVQVPRPMVVPKQRDADAADNFGT
jgi:hypothetical protein